LHPRGRNAGRRGAGDAFSEADSSDAEGAADRCTGDHLFELHNLAFRASVDAPTQRRGYEANLRVSYVANSNVLYGDVLDVERPLVAQVFVKRVS
jgi:hypothetical protein